MFVFISQCKHVHIWVTTWTSQSKWHSAHSSRGSIPSQGGAQTPDWQPSMKKKSLYTQRSPYINDWPLSDGTFHCFIFFTTLNQSMRNRKTLHVGTDHNSEIEKNNEELELLAPAWACIQKQQWVMKEIHLYADHALCHGQQMFLTTSKVSCILYWP